MLVTFNPMINSGASADAAYMNFLRCVRAICTASAGVSSLTVNPFTNNTGTIDNTRNCIVSIDANAEAGGWIESTSSNVIQSGSFTTMDSAAQGLYKFDAYNASNKGTYPYMKLSFHAYSMSSTSGSIYANGNTYGGYAGAFTTYPIIKMTFGCSTTTDWSGTSWAPNTSGYYMASPQLTSVTMNCHGSNTSNAPSSGHPAFWSNNSQVNYRMAVTSTYCIIWEVHTSNSYTAGYSNTFSGNIPSSYGSSWSYGSLMYGGLRETVLWENSRSDNPPWVTMELRHSTYSSQTGSNGAPYAPTNYAAFMATFDDNGIPSVGATRYISCNTYTSEYVFGGGGTPITQGYSSGGSSSSQGANNLGLQIPIFWGREGFQYTGSPTPQAGHQYMPTVDAATGTGVPSAYPIVVKRQQSGSWNPGGAIRGMYKSLGMPIATMKNYFSTGQTYSIYNPVLAVTDTYIPVVFNGTMYLIRLA
jgi:hypothetical protein